MKDACCPPPAQLDRLLAEQLGATERLTVEAHVEGCPACQDWLSRRLDGPTLPRLPPPHLPPDFLRRLQRRPLVLGLRAVVGPGQGRGVSVFAPPAVPGYTIERELGRGGMGVVYRARHERLRRVVALKVLLASGHASATDRARFRAEAEAVARLSHPHIVQVYDVGEHDGQPYLALEHVAGESLAKHLAGRPLPPHAAAELVEALARALHYAHERGVVHRDLKPANILLHNDECRMTNDERSPNAEARNPEGQGGLPPSLGIRHSFVIRHSSFVIPKVTDFGLAKCLDADGLTVSDAVLGTPGYMAPEQAEGRSKQVGPAADVYALGAILYECLTGRPPFVGANHLETLFQVKTAEPVPPTRMQPGLPRDLETVCLRCLAKEPGRRYPTAAELADDLSRFRADRPIRARRTAAWERAWRWCRRHPAPAGLTAALALTFLTGFAAVTAKWREAERARDDERQARQVADDRAEEVRQGLERLKAANALLDRGRWYAGHERWDDAHAALSKAVALRPDHVSVRLERGELNAHLGLWDLAAADFAEAFALQEPDTTPHWYRHAVLRLHVGDADGYRRVCRRMRERFGGTIHGPFAHELIRACALAPGDGVEWAPLVELAQNLDEEDRNWYSLYLLGIAHYRAGQDEQAVRRLRESLTIQPDWSPRFMGYPILALAHHRLGQAAEAREALDEAAQAIDRWTRTRYESQGHYSWVIHRGAAAAWPIAWWDWLEVLAYYREARQQLGLLPPSADPRLRVLRARAFAGLHWDAEAEAEYGAALPLLPQDPRVRLEWHRIRGYLLVHLYQWDRAAEEFARAGELDPEDVYLWRFRAVALHAAGDEPAYRRVCAALMDRFEKVEKPNLANNVLLACTLRPDALADPTRLLPLVRVAAPCFPGGAQVGGAALYRAGRYEEAVRCLEAAARTYRLGAWEWCFLTMAHHRLGHADEARRCRDEAARWIEEANRHQGDDPAENRPAWAGWHEWVAYPLLLHEADAVLGGRE
jgi:serine/threonine protein kinase/tetratricopeptide (TPR) repeat protein